MFIITIVLFTEQSLTTYAGDYGELFGGSSNGPVEIHRKDGSWVGVRFLPEKALEYSPDAIKVAVIDSGVFFGHPQLSGLIIDSKDFSGEGIEDKVRKSIADAGAVLITGPANEKTKLVEHIRLHDPKLTKVIAGVETVDHPSDAQLVAYARKYLTATDRMQS